MNDKYEKNNFDPRVFPLCMFYICSIYILFYVYALEKKEREVKCT